MKETIINEVIMLGYVRLCTRTLTYKLTLTIIDMKITVFFLRYNYFAIGSMSWKPEERSGMYQAANVGGTFRCVPVTSAAR